MNYDLNMKAKRLPFSMLHWPWCLSQQKENKLEGAHLVNSFSGHWEGEPWWRWRNLDEERILCRNHKKGKDPGRREQSVMHRAIRDEVRRQQEPDPERTWRSCPGSQIFSYRKWRPLSLEHLATMGEEWGTRSEEINQVFIAIQREHEC